MPLTEITPPPLNESVSTETGIIEMGILTRTLSVRPQPDGTKTIYVQGGGHETLFTLTQKECAHLAGLLNS